MKQRKKSYPIYFKSQNNEKSGILFSDYNALELPTIININKNWKANSTCIYQWQKFAHFIFTFQYNMHETKNMKMYHSFILF